tara:strand:+ start:327 stop:956 length:630 start_codon:yes stop_codon:yes gene_type:complete
VFLSTGELVEVDPPLWDSVRQYRAPVLPGTNFLIANRHSTGAKQGFHIGSYPICEIGASSFVTGANVEMCDQGCGTQARKGSGQRVSEVTQEQMIIVGDAIGVGAYFTLENEYLSRGTEDFAKMIICPTVTEPEFKHGARAAQDLVFSPCERYLLCCQTTDRTIKAAHFEFLENNTRPDDAGSTAKTLFCLTRRVTGRWFSRDGRPILA